MKVILLFGGQSEEYEISLRSAAALWPALLPRHEVWPVGIDRNGRWLACPHATPEAVAADRWTDGDCFPVTWSPAAHALIWGGEERRADCVFPLLHGQNGEDGKVQGLLSLLGIRYVGCQTAAGAIGMNKAFAKVIAAQNGIPTARGVTVRADELIGAPPLSAKQPAGEAAVCERLEALLPYPMFVKPACSGSSCGASAARCRGELLSALREAFRFGDTALVEEQIIGAEVEFSVLEKDGRLLGTTAGEVEPDGAFYDYRSKYQSRASRIFIPARIPAASAAAVGDYARRLFRLLGCRGLARVDFFVRPSGEVLFNEINTMPGFTDISMFPMLLRQAGLSLPEIADTLLENAVL